MRFQARRRGMEKRMISQRELFRQKVGPIARDLARESEMFSSKSLTFSGFFGASVQGPTSFSSVQPFFSFDFHSTRTMSKPASAAPSDGSLQQVNSLTNSEAPQNHSPVPCSKSTFNAQARDRSIPSGSGKGKPNDDDCGPSIPSNWPSDVVYITQNLVAPSIPDSIAQRYILPPSSSSPPPPTSDPIRGQTSLPRATHNDGHPVHLYTASIQSQVPLVILAIDKLTPWCPDSFHSTSRNLTHHPAAGSNGLFAAQDIDADTFIRPYLGVLHRKKDADFYSTYDLSLCHDDRLSSSSDLETQTESLTLDPETDPAALYLDSRWWGNESRFVNDYRGIAAKPNVEFRSFVQLHDGGETFSMGLFATRSIKRGQELVINYGKSFWVHFEQLEELKSKSQAQAVKEDQGKNPVKEEVKLDPIQAMLQRSRLRISKQPPRPPSRT